MAATLERARTSARYAQRLEDVTGVAARNGAVMIWLSRPLSTLPCRLDIPVVKSGTESRAVPVGSGPYVNAATVYKAFGMAADALPLYAAAREIYEKELPADDARLGGLYNNMALALADLHRFREAEDCYRRALSVMARVEHGEAEAATRSISTRICPSSMLRLPTPQAG